MARSAANATLALVAATLLAACSGGRAEGASEETRFLRTRLLPKLLSWHRGQEQTLELGPLVRDRGYDHFCVILPYNAIDDIADKVPRPIDVYYSEPTTSPSAAGHSVVDGFALIAVKGNEAHSLWVRRSPLWVTVNPKIACYRASHAVLRRIPDDHSPRSYAGLYGQ